MIRFLFSKSESKCTFSYGFGFSFFPTLFKAFGFPFVVFP